jgi:hypothetical protein
MVGTAGNLLGGAVHLTGQAIGNMGRGLGTTLYDAGDSVEAATKGSENNREDEVTNKHQCATLKYAGMESK